MNWKNLLLEAHALDRRAWRLAVAVGADVDLSAPTHAGASIWVAPGLGGELESVAPDGSTAGTAPERRWLRLAATFCDRAPKPMPPAADHPSASDRGRMALALRDTLELFGLAERRLLRVRVLLAAADATYWKLASAIAPRIRPDLPCSDDARQEVLIKCFRLAPRVNPHATDLLNQARGLARRSFFRLGTRIARDERWEFSYPEPGDLVPAPPRTPEERVGASIDAQRGLRECGMPSLPAAIRLARAGGLSEEELCRRLGETPAAVRAGLRGGLRPKRYNTCGAAGCRRKVGFHGRRGLCRRCYYAAWQKPARSAAGSAK
jgi:hypothetical protein